LDIRKPTDLRDDSLGVVLTLDEKFGEIVADDEGHYQYYLPSPEELIALNKATGEWIDQVLEDLKPVAEKVAENELAYEGKIITSTGEKPLVAIPIVRRDCNIQIAWGTGTCLRPSPITSIDPYVDAEYEVPVFDEQMGVGMLMPISAEDVARTLEVGVEYKLREKLKVNQLMDTLWTEMISKGPVWIKTQYHHRPSYRKAATFKKSALNYGFDVDASSFFEAAAEEPTKLIPLSFWNVLYNPDQDDVDRADYLAENTPWSTAQLKARMMEWEEYLLIPDGDRAKLTLSTTQYVNETQQRNVREIEKWAPKIPANYHDVKEVWFRHPMRFYETAEDGRQRKRVRMVELCGAYHYGTRKFIAIWLNPYDHQQKPYTPFLQRKRPFRLSGSNTAEDLAPFQRYIAEILSLTLENAAVANSSLTVVDPDSDAFDWLADHEISADSIIPARKDQINVVSFGREHRSMMPEVDWLNAESSRTSNTSKFESGEAIPTRTPATTVSQILQAGQQQQLMTLRAFDMSWSRAMRQWLYTYRQFNPYGEILPVRQEEGHESKIVELAFRLPAGEVLENFKIALTAAHEGLAREAEIEHLGVLANMLDNDARITAEALQPLVSEQITESAAQIVERLIQRKQDILEEILRLSRTDARSLVITDEMLKRVESERIALRQQLAAAQAAAEQGGMNGPVGNAGAPVPAPETPPGGEAAALGGVDEAALTGATQ
jgi:hypothetical protein